MCGGKSTRFGSSGHKSGTEVQGRPLLAHVIEYWQEYADDFIFIVKHGKEELVDYIKSLPIRSEFVEPERLGGIADGLSYAEPFIDGPFIMVLGDCFCHGEFDFNRNFDYGIGVVESHPEQIKMNYSVEVGDDGLIKFVKEKPEIILNNLCGTGFYFFQKEIFDYIRKTPPSKRTGELEITDTLETLLGENIELTAVKLNGSYVNVTTPQDLDTVREALITGQDSMQDS